MRFRIGLIFIKGVAMKLSELKKEREKCLKELLEMEGWISASLVESARDQGTGPKPFRYLSRSVKGKNKTTYVSSNNLERFRSKVDSGVHAKELFNKITELTILIEKELGKK